MPVGEASIPAGLSPSQRLGQKRKRGNPEADHYNTGDSTTVPGRNEPSRRLRKLARLSYVELAESDIESDAGSGYNSDSSVEWGPRAKQIKVKRSRNAKAEKPFRFLSLPSELRDKIYRLALQDPEGMVLTEGWHAYRRIPRRCQFLRHHNDSKYAGLANLAQPATRQPLRATGSINNQGVRTQYPAEPTVCTLSPSLLAVSKQIYAEAAAILYSQPLHFDSTTALHTFLATLSNETASLVRNITIHTYESCGRGTRKAMNVSALTLLRSCSNLQKLCIEGYHKHNRSYNRGPTTAQARGQRQGRATARQIYRDAVFWLDTIGASKALQILDLPVFQQEDLSYYYTHNRQIYNDQVEMMKHVNIAIAEELTNLIKRTSKPKKKSKKSKTTRASN